MMTRRDWLGTVAAMVGVGLAGRLAGPLVALPAQADTGSLNISDAEWKKKLSADQYAVLRESATERPFSSPLLDEHRAGTFVCAGCALPLFASSTKFDSGTGWPSFYQPLPKAVVTRTDRSWGMVRDEVLCARCGGHLGHVFNDGPAPTGLRYCMNGIALAFVPAAA